LFQILGSRPIPSAISLIFQPVNEAKFAISLMNDNFVARNEFAAYLIISADFISVKTILVLSSIGL
jgi:hypothetical protein